MRHLFVIIGLLISFATQAVSILEDSPRRYVVQPGDTLWSIACKYLANPWEWKTLWHANPRIKNPNRLYPGAIIELRYAHNQPYLKVLSNGTIKLSPNIRPRPLEEAIPPIPLMVIKPFLNSSLVMDEDRLRKAPYIVAFMGEHMLGGQGDEVYVKNLHPDCKMPRGATISYAVYRPNCPYMEPETNRLLGYKATLVGYAELVRGGEPATILLTEITEGVRLKDRVMLNDFPEFNLYFEPKTPNSPVCGSIIDLPGDYTQGAVGLVAVIDRGQDAGLEPGDVLGIYSERKLVADPLDTANPILLPRERVGEVMIFRTFSKTSFGLVVRSIRAIHLGDKVTNP
ncbi:MULTISPECIES: LysM peptidoglycan-binding domain-containing protein [Legionella]|uniref:LysM peptidoglycan-binding domain-containing protein n=1 Tax=Legionella TaxID=445 RepID=UPI001E4F060C|nr:MULTISPECIES: LysM peptidoglycan-binding domain-containing protein [Legionella]MCE3045337.1 LysM peptidoglycan-binding domain-containing protein [Legionella sp. 16cNR16C]MCW8449737.1 LysM peptidoglycan-binding domain-containing protein [Legionella quinlivanii]